MRVPAGVSCPPTRPLSCCSCPLFQSFDDLQQMVSALTGSRQSLWFIHHRFILLLLHPYASWVVHIHLALQLPCIALYAPTYSQSGAAHMRGVARGFALRSMSWPMRRSSTSYVHAPALRRADLPEAFLRGWDPRTDNGTSDNTTLTEYSLRPACDACRHRTQAQLVELERVPLGHLGARG